MKHHVAQDVLDPVGRPDLVTRVTLIGTKRLTCLWAERGIDRRESWWGTWATYTRSERIVQSSSETFVDECLLSGCVVRVCLFMYGLSYSNCIFNCNLEWSVTILSISAVMGDLVFCLEALSLRAEAWAGQELQSTRLALLAHRFLRSLLGLLPHAHHLCCSTIKSLRWKSRTSVTWKMVWAKKWIPRVWLCYIYKMSMCYHKADKALFSNRCYQWRFYVLVAWALGPLYLNKTIKCS